MSINATYLDLCTQVYEISKPTAPEDAFAFYKSYADEASGAILEPMCGTGRFLLPLAKDGYKIEGSDASEHMLDVLMSKAEKMSLNVNIWKSVASEIPDNKIYSLIFIPSGSFGLITDSDEISKTLKSFYNHLDDGGVLVFEVETKLAVPELGVWHGSKWLRPDGKMILLSSCVSIDGDICSSVAKYELIDKNKVIQTEVEEYKIKIYETGKLLELLKSIGFRDVKTLKAFRVKPGYV
ncbi:class I SAM-dependent methyltransferase [Francisella sp. SYW-2]|uniref:methyltransferase domain-containing protein n=1 Tax=Francisella sp. SYW-2 TaxID=2610886 RepID=UPI00123D2D02|nr:class I SAM-dependent methyltransferase [Francisella sp. SYW-2]